MACELLYPEHARFAVRRHGVRGSRAGRRGASIRPNLGVLPRVGRTAFLGTHPGTSEGGRLTPLASDLPEGVVSVVGCGPVPCGRGSDRGPTKKNPGGVTFRMQSCILRSCGAGIGPPAMPIP